MIRFSPSIPIPRMVFVATALGVLHLGAQAQLTCGVPNVGATVTIPPTPQPGLTEAWVDPINGNDATAVVNDATLPFFTATAALAAVSGSIGAGGPTNRGLLHLNAGIYSLLTNGETFPLVMVDWIDIQGVGAKQTILRGTPFDATINAFQPLSDPTCTCGQRVQSRVLVDFSLADNEGYAEMIDGVSFQDSDIQVYAESIQHHLQGRVSNCIFDMLENPDEGYLPPFFGILMVHRWVQDTKGDPTDPTDPPGDGEGGGPGLYRDVFLHAFNNTFLQTWEPDPNNPLAVPIDAQDGSVAICDVNDPRCFMGFTDPNTTLRGVGNPNLQNNLIRSFDPTPPSSMLGIDAGDASCGVGTRLGPTNAFDPTVLGGFAQAPSLFGLTYCSNILGALPVPVTNAAGAALNPNPFTGGVDPAFVGEAQTSQVFIFPASHSRDWRLIATSTYIDQGSEPVANVLTAVNGTSHTEIPCSPQSSFDFDGEYWGNPRIIPSPLGSDATPAAIDIGYDEADVLIDFGTDNDSVVHAPAGDPAFGPFLGFGFRMFVYPDSGGTTPDSHTIWAINSPLVTFPAGFRDYTHFHGSLTLPIVFPGFIFTAPFDLQWLNPAAGLGLFTYVGVTALAPFPFNSAFDGSPQSMSLGFGPSSQAATGFSNYFAEQGIYMPTGGPKAGLLLLSNLQGLHD